MEEIMARSLVILSPLVAVLALSAVGCKPAEQKEPPANEAAGATTAAAPTPTPTSANPAAATPPGSAQPAATPPAAAAPVADSCSARCMKDGPSGLSAVSADEWRATPKAEQENACSAECADESMPVEQER
jgi:hypothetical protein